MSITSAGFLVFLLITFCCFYICPVKSRWIILLISSIVFYVLAGAVYFLPFILFSALVVWLCARQIGMLYEKQDTDLSEAGDDRAAKKEIRESYKKKAKAILILALVLCIGVLVISKFGNYLVEFLNQLMPAEDGSTRFDSAMIIVPLGISYYTFSSAGYLLDVYWKRYPYEKNFARFFLYAIYFPHIIQGPISRYNQLGQELKKELRFDSKRICYGMELMLWGFFKKMVIADRLAIFVSNVFNGEDRAGCIFLIGLLFDAVMIYTDFSGYMDIVRGASQIFGVELESNFDHPFFAETVPEFWRRWHITLGAWFKDYVYYPLTVSGWMKKIGKGSRKHLPEVLSRFVSVSIPMMITWILTGLWHGTGVTYICWGFYYGALITISGAFEPEFQKLNEKLKIRTDCFSWKLFRKIRTSLCFVGGRLLTTPGSLYMSFLILRTMIFGFAPGNLFNGTLFTFGLSKINFYLALFCILVLWVVSLLQERFSIREKLSEQNLIFRWIIIFVAIFAILIFGIYGKGYEASSFVYENF